MGSPSPRRRTTGARAGALMLAAALCGVALAGCGQARQDAYEPARSFQVQVTQASFPAKQAIARPTKMSIEVRNSGSRTIPNIAVTVDSLSYRATKPANLADPRRPTWIIYTGPGPVAHPSPESEELTPPGGGETAFVHTWALGRLPAGATKSFTWKLMPVVSGTKTVHYTVAAGLNGRARAVLTGKRVAAGSFTVHIAPAPPATHVNPLTGEIAAGPYTVSPGPVGAVP